MKVPVNLPKDAFGFEGMRLIRKNLSSPQKMRVLLNCKIKAWLL